MMQIEKVEWLYTPAIVRSLVYEAFLPVLSRKKSVKLMLFHRGEWKAICLCLFEFECRRISEWVLSQPVTEEKRECSFAFFHAVMHRQLAQYFVLHLQPGHGHAQLMQELRRSRFKESRSMYSSYALRRALSEENPWGVDNPPVSESPFRR